MNIRLTDTPRRLPLVEPVTGLCNPTWQWICCRGFWRAARSHLRQRLRPTRSTGTQLFWPPWRRFLGSCGGCLLPAARPLVPRRALRQDPAGRPSLGTSWNRLRSMHRFAFYSSLPKWFRRSAGRWYGSRWDTCLWLPSPGVPLIDVCRKINTKPGRAYTKKFQHTASQGA